MGVRPFTQKLPKIIFNIIIKNIPILPPSTTGEIIKAERLKLGWTGCELGDYLDVSYASIYSWENGGKIYRHKHRRLISYFIGKSVR